MPTTVYVARSLGVDTGLLTGEVGTIVGDDDALDSRDGDGSYIQAGFYGALSGHYPEERREQMPFRWALASGGTPPSDAVATITAEIRKDDTDTADLSIQALSPLSGVGTLAPWVATSTTYTEVVEPGLSSVQTARILNGEPWAITPFDPGITLANVVRVTYLVATFTWGGTPPLRQRNRDTIRARNLASRQRGIRARGYL
jgi:hypothetical protein